MHDETKDALERVECAADEDWKEAALKAVRTIAGQKPSLISYDVLQAIGRTGTHELRALGPVMLKAARNGWIKKTQEFVPYPDASRHDAPTRVWTSLINEGGAHDATV